MKRTGPTNPYLRKLVEELKKKSFELKAPIWMDVAEKLERPRRRKIEVNLADIERNANKNEIIVVPGVVLGSGELTKPVSVAAWRFSPAAEEKIKKSKGKTMTIEELSKENPKGSGVKILV
jgi:large subunit ribosomal protein L18e